MLQACRVRCTYTNLNRFKNRWVPEKIVMLLELDAAVQQHNKSCELLLYLAPQQAQHLGVRSYSLVHVTCADTALEGLARVKVDLKLSHDMHSILKCPTSNFPDEQSKLSKIIKLHITFVDERSIQQWDCLEVLPSDSTSAAEALTIARPQALHSFLLGSVVRDGAPTLVQPAMVRTVGGGRRQQQHSSTDQSDELQLNSWGVVTASTVIVGPDAAFSVRFYDREAHLSVPAATEAVLRCHPVPLVQGVASRILRACSTSSSNSSNTRAAVLPLLLHGPPGVGKSLLIEALARALRCRLVVVSAGRLAAAAGVDADAALQRALTYCSACSAERTVLLLDSADKLFPAAEGRVGRSLGDSDVALLNRLVLAAAAAGSRSSATTAAAATAAATDAVTDASTAAAAAAAGVVVQSQSSSGAVVIIGVTSALSCLNPTARKCFAEEVEVLPPSDALRAVVLRAAIAQTLPQAAQQQLSLSSKPDTPASSAFAATGDAVVRIAQAAQGFSAADLHAVASAAGALLQQQQQQVTAAHAHSAVLAPQQPAQLLTSEQALWRALHSIKPAVALARGSSSSSSSDSSAAAAAAAAAVPLVQWADVGGLHRAKAALQEMVVWPQTRPEAFARLGITPAAGVLLYGPPGTGKTLLAKGEHAL
jgi:SpoVK/Ycf46/Vps4 family AAA+-type ATPase